MLDFALKYMDRSAGSCGREGNRPETQSGQCDKNLADGL